MPDFFVKNVGGYYCKCRGLSSLNVDFFYLFLIRMNKQKLIPLEYTKLSATVLIYCVDKRWNSLNLHKLWFPWCYSMLCDYVQGLALKREEYNFILLNQAVITVM